jgi:hypothetical protein
MAGYDVKLQNDGVFHVDADGSTSIRVGDAVVEFALSKFYQAIGIPSEEVETDPVAFAAFLIDLAVNGDLQTADGETHALAADTRAAVFAGLRAGVVGGAYRCPRCGSTTVVDWRRAGEETAQTGKPLECQICACSFNYLGEV